MSFQLVVEILKSVRWPDCCCKSVPRCWFGDCKCTITKVRLGTWNLEITVCCRVKMRTSSVFSGWLARLIEIFWCSAMDSFEHYKTELVFDPLRHVQPIKSVVQRTRYSVTSVPLHRLVLLFLNINLPIKQQNYVNNNKPKYNFRLFLNRHQLRPAICSKHELLRDNYLFILL